MKKVNMVSVCMATYNGEKYIKEQLESILIQLSDVDELIISDDHSTDSTINVIKECYDSRIKIFMNDNYKGVIGNFENALKYSKGDYIFLSDQDDVWLPEKVANMIELLQEYDCVVSDNIVVNKNMDVIFDSFFKINRSKNGFMHNLIKNGYSGCCMAINRKILNYALPFPSDIITHDMWIGLIAEIYGKTFFYDNPLIYHRRHGDNASPTSEKSPLALKTRIYYRFNLIKNIIKRIYERK